MLSPLDYAVLAVFLAGILGLGFRAGKARKEGLDDYLLAGRSLTLPSFVATLVPSFFGGVMGVGEYTYRYGISNWIVQGVPYYFFGLLYAWLLVEPIRGFPGRTLPDHLEGVFGKRTAVVAAFWVALLANPATEMLMLGTVARWATGWPLFPCIAGSALLGLSFLAVGGLRADVWTNRLEIIVMFAGFAVVLPFAFRAVGGWQGLQSSLPAAHLDPTGGNSWGYLLTWFFIAFWTFVDPAFHQRVCAAKDAGTARRGILLSIGFWCVFDLMTTSAGLCARSLAPDLTDPLLAYPELAARLLPPVARGIFLAGMCSSIIAAMGALSFVSATTLAKDAAARLWAAPPEKQERWVRWGLLATGLSSVLLAFALPSVVALWYAVGSAAVPGLLLVTLSCYFKPLRTSPRGALACSALGGGVSLAWLAWGMSHSSHFPWGVEPFYPGLMVSIAAWAAGRPHPWSLEGAVPSNAESGERS